MNWKGHKTVLLIVVLVFKGSLLHAICPIFKRHVPYNAVYYELGGVGIYNSIGYSLQLNGGFNYNYFVSTNIGYVFCPQSFNSQKPTGLAFSFEFHGMTKKKGPVFLTGGAGISRLNYSESVDLVSQNISRFSPMIGVEYMIQNRVSFEIKYQPYVNLDQIFEFELYKPLLGIKAKLFIGYGDHYYKYSHN